MLIQIYNVDRQENDKILEQDKVGTSNANKAKVQFTIQLSRGTLLPEKTFHCYYRVVKKQTNKQTNKARQNKSKHHSISRSLFNHICEAINFNLRSRDW